MKKFFLVMVFFFTHLCGYGANVETQQDLEYNKALQFHHTMEVSHCESPVCTIEHLCTYDWGQLASKSFPPIFQPLVPLRNKQKYEEACIAVNHQKSHSWDNLCEALELSLTHCTGDYALWHNACSTFVTFLDSYRQTPSHYLLVQENTAFLISYFLLDKSLKSWVDCKKHARTDGTNVKKREGVSDFTKACQKALAYVPLDRLLLFGFNNLLDLMSAPLDDMCASSLFSALQKTTPLACIADLYKNWRHKNAHDPHPPIALIDQSREVWLEFASKSFPSIFQPLTAMPQKFQDKRATCALLRAQKRKSWDSLPQALDEGVRVLSAYNLVESDVFNTFTRFLWTYKKAQWDYQAVNENTMFVIGYFLLDSIIHTVARDKGEAGIAIPVKKSFCKAIAHMPKERLSLFNLQALLSMRQKSQ